MLLMPIFFTAIVVFAILGGLLRIAVPLILVAAALRRQQMTMPPPQVTLPHPLVVPPNFGVPPVAPPATGQDIYMPGGPVLKGSQVFVPGMTPRWPR